MKSVCCVKNVFAMEVCCNKIGLYCRACGKWQKWANKNEKRMIAAGLIDLKGCEEK